MAFLKKGCALSLLLAFGGVSARLDQLAAGVGPVARSNSASCSGHSSRCSCPHHYRQHLPASEGAACHSSQPNSAHHEGSGSSSESSPICLLKAGCSHGDDLSSPLSGLKDFIPEPRSGLTLGMNPTWLSDLYHCQLARGYRLALFHPPKALRSLSQF
jgi:hypothetical protein